jgi:hypothetical protein
MQLAHSDRIPNETGTLFLKHVQEESTEST